ncbi:uncharacterized protein YALI1_C05507g [Yarrowia lipolytica]|uniref:Uncharacterized protein n=1 Tax=Yarrowia lipolytica TaxID=4952 RepID=A0A1D8N9K5_YARLL|nr:hypothetical protein YALI1_C05507g [Yarrowia lipolytica]
MVGIKTSRSPFCTSTDYRPFGIPNDFHFIGPRPSLETAPLVSPPISPPIFHPSHIIAHHRQSLSISRPPTTKTSNTNPSHRAFHFKPFNLSLKLKLTW